MASSIEKHVPVFNGSNFRTWSTSMINYLCTSGLYQIVAGDISKPESLQGTSKTDGKLLGTWLDPIFWSEKDMTTIGLIRLCLNDAIKEKTKDKKTSKKLYDYLAYAYKETTFAHQYGIYTETLRLRVSGSHDPTNDIEKLSSLYQQLKEQNLEIPHKIQIMTLLHALPKHYKILLTTLLSSAKLTNWDIVSEQIHNDYQKKVFTGNNGPSANKITLIKRHRENPQWVKKPATNNTPQNGNNQTTSGSAPKPSGLKPFKGKGKGCAYPK